MRKDKPCICGCSPQTTVLRMLTAEASQLALEAPVAAENMLNVRDVVHGEARALIEAPVGDQIDVVC